MAIWKRIVAGFLAAVFLSALIGTAGCGFYYTGDTQVRSALTVCTGAAPKNLDPIYAEETTERTILNHVYENLMRKTSKGVINGMARRVDQKTNADGTVKWIFHLRNSKWSDGMPVTASDFVYAWRRLVNPANVSSYGSLLSIVAGYDQVLETGDPTNLQVFAEDDSQVFVVILNGNYSGFLTEVCSATATLPQREDIGEDVEKMVANGPYEIKSRIKNSENQDDVLELKENIFYRGGMVRTREKIPDIQFYFADSPETAQTLYRKKTVDFLGILSASELGRRARRGMLQPESKINMVLINCTRQGLDSQKVRQALSLVIDRDILAQEVGACAKLEEGLIPSVVLPDNALKATKKKDEEIDLERCKRAVELWSESGVAVQDLGDLEYLYIDKGPESQKEANLLAKMWKNQLKIEIKPKAVTTTELQTALYHGKYDLANVCLGSQAADAEFFLLSWRSDLCKNVCGYTNSAFDALGAIISNTVVDADDNNNSAVRLNCIHDAESLLLEDCPALPLYSIQTAWESRENQYIQVYHDPRGWFWFGA